MCKRNKPTPNSVSKILPQGKINLTSTVQVFNEGTAKIFSILNLKDFIEYQLDFQLVYHRNPFALLILLLIPIYRKQFHYITFPHNIGFELEVINSYNANNSEFKKIILYIHKMLVRIESEYNGIDKITQRWVTQQIKLSISVGARICDGYLSIMTLISARLTYRDKYFEALKHLKFVVDHVCHPLSYSRVDQNV